MKRMQKTWCLLLLVFCIPFVALGSAGAEDWDGVRAGGIAGSPTGETNFYISAYSGPNGENASGFTNFYSATIENSDGNVTQLCVSGNKAVVSGQIIAGSYSGSGFVFYVEDRLATGLPDLIQIEILDSVPDTCPPFYMSQPLEVFLGDIQIHDGIALAMPVANAGADQSVHQGTAVTLDGSGSSDPNGNYPLSYAWQIVSTPAGSTASLSDFMSVNPSFTADAAGDYIVQLVVTNSQGAASIPDEVMVSTYNTPPVADAGNDQAIMLIGTLVTLDGSQSYDPEGDHITYQWAISTKPAASAATLSDPTSATPTFVADVNGTYEISLVVSDAWVSGATDQVVISFNNVKPVADAGGNQSITLGEMMYFDGRGSSDVNLDPLAFSWSIASKPEGSYCELSNALTAQAEFLPDVPGTYVVSLVVNDGIVDSDPSNVTITVMSRQDQPEKVLHDLIQLINNLDCAVFKNCNMANAMTNKINAVLSAIEQGNYTEAINKLRNDILVKTDGCAASGYPDKNDWLKTCEGQNQVYPLVMEAIQLLENM